MPGLFRLRLERVRDGGARAQRRVLRDADRERDAVRRREADPPQVAAEPVRVRLHDGHRVRTVAADNLRHLVDGDAVRLPEDHRIAQRLVRVPARADLLDLRPPQLRHLPQPPRLVRQHVQRPLPERLHDAVRQDLADALDQPRGEIALDAGDGLRRDARDGRRLELPPVHLVRHPLPFRRDVLALPDRLRLADERERAPFRQLERGGRGDRQYGVAVLVVVVDDALHGAFHRLGRRFGRGGCGLGEGRGHFVFLRSASAAAVSAWRSEPPCACADPTPSTVTRAVKTGLSHVPAVRTRSYTGMRGGLSACA